MKRMVKDARASLCTDGIIPDVVVVVIQSPLDDLGRVFYEVEEFWRRENTDLLFLGHLCADASGSA